ncbi:hypothetical protein, partial [Bifidobacterium adolescentis]|uniref:hypothetical protein n=1 Tax=Bifidobacterium adolescentis TaxID=1680 RepID=UPI00210B0961
LTVTTGGRHLPEPEALIGFQVGISRFLDFSSLEDNTTPRDQRGSHRSRGVRQHSDGFRRQAMAMTSGFSPSC